jgi:hypothetical protein
MTGTSEKCIACFPKIEQGMQPQCFVNCIGKIRLAGWISNRAGERAARQPHRLPGARPEGGAAAVSAVRPGAERLLHPAPGLGRMVDAAAIQIPARLSPEPPAPQMGDEAGAVHVTYWRADWQAAVNGRGDTIQDLYPNATVDHYPFQAQSLEPGSDAQREMAQRYAPARALGNLRAGPREKPVEDLIATGPGTLGPGPSLDSNGAGNHTRDSWSVVISRKLPEGLAPDARTQIAFAVWQGSEQESGARKMRTGWIPLVVRNPK